eukprot:scaffold107308_cov18-Tisochrysis_lutea.AAC.2
MHARAHTHTHAHTTVHAMMTLKSGLADAPRRVQFAFVTISCLAGLQGTSASYLIAQVVCFCDSFISCWAAGNICIYCPGGPDSDFEYSTQVCQLLRVLKRKH